MLVPFVKGCLGQGSASSGSRGRGRARNPVPSITGCFEGRGGLRQAADGAGGGQGQG